MADQAAGTSDAKPEGRRRGDFGPSRRLPEHLEDKERHAPGRLSRRVHPCQRQAGRWARDAGPFDRRGKDLGPSRAGRRRSDDGRPQRRDLRDGRRYALRHLRQVPQGRRPGRAPLGVADDQQGRGPNVGRPGQGEQDRRRSYPKPRHRPGRRHVAGPLQRIDGLAHGGEFLRHLRPEDRGGGRDRGDAPGPAQRGRRDGGCPRGQRRSGRPDPQQRRPGTVPVRLEGPAVGRGRSACPAAFPRSSRRPT